MEQQEFNPGLLVKIVKPNNLPYDGQNGVAISWIREMDQTNYRIAALTCRGSFGKSWKIDAFGFYYMESWLRVATPDDIEEYRNR